MNVFTLGHRHQPWVWQVTALCFILGVLLAGSLQTVSSIRAAGTSSGRVGFPLGPSSQNKINSLQKEILDLRNSKTVLEQALGKGSSQVKALNDELQQTKLLAGLTDVEGPGIVLMLQDSPKGAPSNRQFDREKYIIHDVDLQQVVNELLASGAEAVSINDQRFTCRTAIRCVGPTIQVNGVPIAPPFYVQAIGVPGTLMEGLNLPGGLLDGLRWVDKGMCQLEKRPHIVIHAYTGSTEMREAKSIPARDTTTGKGAIVP